MRSIAGKSRVSKEGPSLASSTFAQPLRPQSSSPMSAMAIAASGDSEKVASSSSSGVANGGGSGGGGGATQSFALPVHTDELGRLPLHPGFNVSYSTPDWGHAQQQQQPQQQQALPHGVSSVVAASSAVPAASRTPDIVSAQFDPRLMAMYNLQGPGFGDMFNAAAAVPSEPSAFAPAQLPPDLQAMAAAAAAAGAAGDAMDATGGAMTSEELAFADNTLAMWSTALTSFEYVSPFLSEALVGVDVQLGLKPRLGQRDRRLPKTHHLRDDERAHIRQRLRTPRELVRRVLIRHEQLVNLPHPVPVPNPVLAQRLSLHPPLRAQCLPLAPLLPPKRRHLARLPELRIPPPLVLLHRPPEPTNLEQLVPPLPRCVLARPWSTRTGGRDARRRGPCAAWGRASPSVRRAARQAR